MAGQPTDVASTFCHDLPRCSLAALPAAILQLYPDSLAVTNSWAFAGDHDLAGVEVGGEHAEGGLLTLHFRRDKKVGRVWQGVCWAG